MAIFMSQSASPQSSLPPASRVKKLPKYVFAALEQARAEVEARGLDIIDLGMGNPDIPTPQPILDAIERGLKNPENYRYPNFAGKPAFRHAVCRWMATRYGVNCLDPDQHIQALIGSKEGVSHLNMAYADTDAVNLVWSPHYPVHARANLIAGGNVHFVHMNDDNNYLPALNDIPETVAKRARLLFMSYPNNPTTAVAPKSYLQELLAFCRQHQIILVSDLAYGEIFYEDAARPTSILELDGALDVSIEFHSCSKAFSMAGFRVGFAAGNPEVVQNLHAIKTNCDYGLAGIIQDGAIQAYNHGEDYLPDIIAEYRTRRDAWVNGINAMGWDVPPPEATLYVWHPIPAGYDTAGDFCQDVLEKTGVIITPGSAFGHLGEGYFRTALVAPVPRLEEALARLKQAGFNFTTAGPEQTKVIAA
jgi:LL-diaminopimelate aminotransferase